MTEEQPPHEPSEKEESHSLLSVILRRVVGPAAAIVILYASIRALPSLIVNQAPPIDGDDLLIAFLISLAGFTGLAVWFDWRGAKKGTDE